MTLFFWSLPVGSPAYTSFIEGWGLYSEFLGHEMGLFDEDPNQLLGFYSFNLIRACRLVIDTGIHAKGWTRQQAVDYLSNNTALGLYHVEGESAKFSKKFHGLLWLEIPKHFIITKCIKMKIEC